MATKTFTVSKQYMADTITGSANPGDLHIPIGLWPTLGWKTRAILYAPISFSGMTAITSARLYIYVHAADGTGHVNGSGTVGVRFRRITRDWSETSGGVSSSVDEVWGGNGRTYVVDYTAFDGVPDQSIYSDAASGTLTFWDITETVQAWFEGAPNYGIKIEATNEDSTAEAFELYSRHSSFKPYIWIEYETNTAPNAPTNLQPTGSAVRHTGSTVSLSGTRSDADSGDYITAYQVQVYNDAETSKLADQTVSVAGTPTTFSRSISGLPTNTFLKWRARTRDRNNAWGPYSAFQRFKLNTTPNAPSLALQESPTSDVKTLTPTFKVTHSDPDSGDTKAYKYEIELQTSGGGAVWDTGEVSLGSPVTTVSKLYNGPGLSWDTSYRWRARTQDANGQWSGFSSWATFTTHQTGTPVSLSPSAVTVGNLAPTFSGSRASSADSLTSAQVQVYDSTGATLIWDSGTFTTGVTSTGFTKAYGGTTLAFGTTYKWRARVTGSIGGTSDWTSLQSFTTPAADAIQITAPLGSGITDLTPQIEFSRTNAFNAYEIEVVRVSDSQTMWDTGTVSIGSSQTSRSITYAGAALAWATEYKFRVRVSSDNGSTWGNGFTDYANFTTEEAGVPTLTAPDVDEWINDTTPTFTGTTENAETISTFRIVVYASDQTTVIWDSGALAGSGTSFSTDYAGSTALTRGDTYYWTAQYTETTGPTGGFAPLRAFSLNKAPNAPSARTPATGNVIADTLTPEFTATFSDADKDQHGDTPTAYEVEVYRNSDDVLMHTLSTTSNLVAGANTLQRVAEGTALSYEVQYKWRARYTDSFGEVGAWSSFNVFKPSESPTVSSIAPAATVNSPSFAITWTFTSPGSKTQSQYRVWITRDSDDFTVYDSGLVLSDESTLTLPGGYLVNNTDYTIHIVAYDTDGLVSTEATETINSVWDAPDPISGFSVSALEETSTMLLRWDISNLDQADFSYYQIYRRLLGDEDWDAYSRITNQSTTEYSDYYAGNSLTYEYKVTVWKKVVGDVDVESPDSEIPYALLDSDVWFVIGADRDESHSFELPVSSESHAQPIQQEVFEPLGSNRKSVVRGRVLGNEGSLECQWTNAEHLLAQEQVSYIVNAEGPHILKSPFGDVWEVEFSGPSKRYTGGGHLSMTLTWIEVV